MSPRRIAAWLLDCIVLGIISIPVNPVLGLSNWVVALAAGTVVAFVYLVGFDASERGATPGKRLVQLRVVGDDGHGIGAGRAFGRRVVYVLGALLAFAGWVWALTNPQRKTWHDLAAGTRVVRADG